MLVRWSFLLLITIFDVLAIPRPDMKTALRGLAQLPRVEFRVSLDFDAERGFVALRTSKDPAFGINDAGEKLTGPANEPRFLLEAAAQRVDLGEVTRARRDLMRAVDLLRKRLEYEPGSLRPKLDLAMALHGLGRQPESESLLRDVVKTAPGSLTNWLAFSAFLEARGWEIAADVQNWRGRVAYSELSASVLRNEPTTEIADRAARYFAESFQSAQRAVEIDDKSAAAHYRLAIAIASKDCFETLRVRINGQDAPGPLLGSLIFSPKSLPALDKAASLDSENPARLATSLLWRGFAAASSKQIVPGELLRRSAWEHFNVEEHRRIEVGFDDLENLAASSKGGAAYQAVGTLRFVLRGDLRGAAVDLRRAVDALPDSEQAWETLSAVLLRSKDIETLAVVCEARADTRPTARNRFLVAKAHEKLGHTDRVEEELLAALAVNANDFNANIAMANLLMKQSSDESLSPRVRQFLAGAERSVRGSGSGQQLVELALSQGIYHGLSDELDRARDILKAALAYAKDNTEVAAALNAIGY